MPKSVCARFIYIIFAVYSGCYPLISHSTTDQGVSDSPTVIKLVEVSSIKTGSLTISWLPTTDDNTPHKQLRYQVYLSEKEDFLPDSSTLKAAVTGGVSAHINHLKPDQRYFVLVTATDLDGNVSYSNLLEGRTVAINAKRTQTAVHNVSAMDMQTAANQGRVALRARAKPITTGDYLVNGEQGGYLRQVISTSKAKTGDMVADTASAPLNEIFSELSFTTTVKLQDIPETSAGSAKLAVKANSTNTEASVIWKDTGLTLSSDDPFPTNTPSRRSRSQLDMDGKQQILSGEYMTISAPAYVSAQPNQPTSWKAVMRVPVLKNSGTELCNAELVSFSHTLKTKNRLLPKPTMEFKRFADQNGEFRSGRLQMQWQPTDAHVDLNGWPYRAKIKAFVDLKNNNCRGVGGWQETLEMDIPVYVTQGTPDATEQNQRITFQGGFKVDDRVSYDIKPELTIGAAISGGRLQTANLLAKADLSFTNKLTITATGAATLNQRIPLLREKKFIKVFMAGTVPIVVSGSFKIDAQLDGTVNGKAALEKLLELRFPDTRFGLKYQKGGWQTVGTINPAYQFKITGEADANTEVTITLIPDLQVSFYDAASGRLLVEPYLFAQAGLHGPFKYQGIAPTDLDYWFTDLQAGAGADMRLYAGLSIFDYTIASYPANTTIDQIDDFYVQALLPKTPLAKLPTLTAVVDESPDIAAPTDSRTMLVQGKSKDFVDSVLKKSLISFKQWTEPSVVTADGAPAEGAKLKAADQKGHYWFTYQAAGTYTVRLAAYNSLGWFVRQVAEQEIVLTDDDNDGMVDQWETRYGVSEPDADDDEDGVDNLAEFRAGSYPNEEYSHIGVLNGNNLADINISPSSKGLYDISVIPRSTYFNISNIYSLAFKPFNKLLIGVSYRMSYPGVYHSGYDELAGTIKISMMTGAITDDFFIDSGHSWGGSIASALAVSSAGTRIISGGFFLLRIEPSQKISQSARFLNLHFTDASSISSLAYSSDDILYGWDRYLGLVKIDPNLIGDYTNFYVPAVTKIGVLPPKIDATLIESIEFIADGTLIAVLTDNSFGSKFYKVDTSTGKTTYIGSTPYKITALARK